MKVSISAMVEKDLKDRAINIIQNKLGLTISKFIENKLIELLKHEKK